jgi:hypothetical protein
VASEPRLEEGDNVPTAGALQDATVPKRAFTVVMAADSRGRHRACCGACHGAWNDHLSDSHKDKLQRLGVTDEGEDASAQTMGSCGDRRRRRSQRLDGARRHLQCNAAPSEMVSTLAFKPTAKEAWEALKTMRISNERMRKSTAQRLRREYEMLSFWDNESVEAFALRLTDVVAQLAMLGDPESLEKVVENYLRIAHPRYKQLVVSIETLLDVLTLMVEDITGRLKAAEDADDAPPPSMRGKLYLTEEQWEAQWKEKGGDAGMSKSGDRRRRPRRGAPASSGGTGTGPSHKLGRDRCRKCGKTSHWAHDCKTRPKQEAAHMA